MDFYCHLHTDPFKIASCLTFCFFVTEWMFSLPSITKLNGSKKHWKDQIKIQIYCLLFLNIILKIKTYFITYFEQIWVHDVYIICHIIHVTSNILLQYLKNSQLTKMQMRVGSNICNSDKIFKEGIGQETNIPLVSSFGIAGNFHT